jgi:adenosylcobinamide-GDP ribazoletransferase
MTEPPGSGHRPLLADPRALFGFFSRLPLGRGAPIERVVASFPLVPIVGWAVGGCGAAVALALTPLLPASASAAVLLVVVVGLTGFNQTDGLLDLGDGLMVHGDADRRLSVMHDHSAGAGAVAAGLFTYLLSYGALAGIAGQVGASVEPHWLDSGAQKLAAALVLAEVTARLPYLLLAWLGRPSHGGLGERFMAEFGPVHVAIGMLVAAPALVAAAWLGWVPVAFSLGAAVVVTLWLLATATRLFGGVGGDVFGASQELARAAALLAISLGLTL